MYPIMRDAVYTGLFLAAAVLFSTGLAAQEILPDGGALKPIPADLTFSLNTDSVELKESGGGRGFNTGSGDGVDYPSSIEFISEREIIIDVGAYAPTWQLFCTVEDFHGSGGANSGRLFIKPQRDPVNLTKSFGGTLEISGDTLIAEGACSDGKMFEANRFRIGARLGITDPAGVYSGRITFFALAGKSTKPVFARSIECSFCCPEFAWIFVCPDLMDFGNCDIGYNVSKTYPRVFVLTNAGRITVTCSITELSGSGGGRFHGRIWD